MATVDFKSSAGVGILHNFKATKDAAIIDLVKERHGVVFGKTNVPEFAGSLVTCNYGAC
jgi:Asp-tRNA(Asn)/Glu-tRNA(Gln) amidotransferase A subunit family amidase